MKGFWEKTKNTFAVGVARAEELINDKKIEEDPEFIDKEQKLEEMNKEFNALHVYLQDLNNLLSKSGQVLSNVCDCYKNIMGTTGPENQQTSAMAGQIGSNIRAYSKNATSFYIPTHALDKLKVALNELDVLEKIRNDAKTNLVIYKKKEEELKKAQLKGSHDVDSLNQETEELKNKYETSYKGFVSGVQQLYERKVELCTETFSASIKYTIELMKVTQEEFDKNLPQIGYEANSEKFPSLSIVPPTTE